MDDMDKSQLALGLGIGALIGPCIPCIGWMIHMVCLVGAMIAGFMAHSEAKESGASTTLAKVGMLIALIPEVALVLFMIAYVFILVFAMIMSNM
jgi:uncharacterized protein YqgC (DUF456 family)